MPYSKQLQAAKLNNRIEVWGNERGDNELSEVDNDPKLMKTIWAEIIPQTGSLQKQQANTVLADVTHKVVIRYSSGKDIQYGMWFMYKGHRFDIKYILNPYFKNESLEIFCSELIE